MSAIISSRASSVISFRRAPDSLISAPAAPLAWSAASRVSLSSASSSTRSRDFSFAALRMDRARLAKSSSLASHHIEKCFGNLPSGHTGRWPMYRRLIDDCDNVLLWNRPQRAPRPLVLHARGHRHRCQHRSGVRLIAKLNFWPLHTYFLLHVWRHKAAAADAAAQRLQSQAEKEVSVMSDMMMQHWSFSALHFRSLLRSNQLIRLPGPMPFTYAIAKILC